MEPFAVHVLQYFDYTFAVAQFNHHCDDNKNCIGDLSECVDRDGEGKKCHCNKGLFPVNLSTKWQSKWQCLQRKSISSYSLFPKHTLFKVLFFILAKYQNYTLFILFSSVCFSCLFIKTYA